MRAGITNVATRHMQSFVWVLSVTFLLGAPSARAANGDWLWHPEGELVGPGDSHAVVSDSAGGVFVAWDDGPGVRIQHLDSTGTPQWTAPGIQVTSTGSMPALDATFPYGVTVAWKEGSGIEAQRFDYAGVAQWTAGGVQVATLGHVPVVLHAPGPGPFDPPGAFIAWGEVARIAYLDGSGVVTAPGVDGIALGSSVRLPLPNYMRIVDDAAGGAIVVWADHAKNIVAQRVNAGLPWGATPTIVSNDVRDEGPLSLAPDGSGGALISWSATQLFPANGQVRAQRIDSSGVGQWAANGVVVVDSTVVGGHTTAWSTFGFESSIVGDGGGGAFIAWSDWRNDPTLAGNDDIYAQRLDGSFGSGLWTAGGVLVPAYIVGSTAPGSQRHPRIASDGHGGAVVTYQDLGGTSYDIGATRLDAYGNKLFSGYAFTDSNHDQLAPAIVSDGSGPSPTGAVVVWADQRSGLDVRAQKLEISGPPNDPHAAPQTVASYTQVSGTTLAATPDGSSSCGGGGETDVWYYFEPPPWPGTLEVDTCGTHDANGADTGTDTVLSIHSGAPGTSANELACNDDWVSGGAPVDQCAGTDTGVPRDSATAAVLSGSPVWIRVSHYPSTTPGDFVLNVRYVPEPSGFALLASGLAGLVAIERRRQRGSRQAGKAGRCGAERSSPGLPHSPTRPVRSVVSSAVSPAGASAPRT